MTTKSEADLIVGFRHALHAFTKARAACHDDPSPENTEAVQSASLNVVDLFKQALAGGRFPRAILDVATERSAQVRAGYDAAHDDGHTLGEIGMAAALFAGHGDFKVNVTKAEDVPLLEAAFDIRRSASWRTDTDRRRCLIAAAALAVAEVERLDRIDWGLTGRAA